MSFQQDDNTVSVNGTELFVATRGEGPPLLTMHGGLGLDHTYFRPWLDRLGAVAEVIYYDHRGNGRSARPVDWDAVDMDTWVEDAEALRAELNLEHTVLFGHSYGGCLAQEYALRYPDRLDGLILASTMPALDYPEVILANAEARGTPEEVQAAKRALAEPFGTDEDMRAGFAELLPLYFHAPDREREAQAIGRMLEETRFSAAASAASVASWASFNTLGRLEEIDCPTLILSGADDWIAPLAEGAERLRKRLPQAKAVTFEQSGHFPFIEEPDRFTETVAAWIDALD